MEWLVPADQVSQDDLTRAVAEKAEAILRSARFIGQHQQGDRTDMEVRVWIEAAHGPACVSITWEPGYHAFGFHVLDESLRERLACVVFHELPCIRAETSASQAESILRATLAAIREAEEDTVRVPVIETARRDVGIDP